MQSYNLTSARQPNRGRPWRSFAWRRGLSHLLLSALILGGGFFTVAQPAYAAGITVNGATCTLANAITAANTDTATGGCPAGSGADIITISTDITLAAELPKIAGDLTIQGDTPTRFVSGDQKYRVFWVQSGNVTFQNLTIRNGQATGSNGSNATGSSTISGGGMGGGGGALGAGGGLYIHSGNVTVANVTFRQNVAQGGKGGLASPVGNGQGGNFDNSGGGVAGASGAAGGFGAGGGGGAGTVAGAASLLGGKGGPATSGNITSGGNGGAIGGGSGGAGAKSIGGGGGGAGGAIFIRYGTLTLNNNIFTQNSALGTGNGKGDGAAVFVCTSQINAACGASLAPGSILPTQTSVVAAGAGVPLVKPLPGKAQGNNTVTANNVAGQGQAIFPAPFGNSVNSSPAAVGGVQVAGKPIVNVAVATQSASRSAATADLPPGLTGVVALAGGDEHGLALKDDGTVVAWGDNSRGQGVVPAGLSGVVAIAAGAYHNLALKSNGSLVAWGDNRLGQSTIPTGLSGVLAIAAGGYHSLALLTDGTVVGWGSNVQGQISVPTGLRGVVAIAAGAEHSLALKSDGTVVAWGNNGYGQLDSPAGLKDVTAIAAGQYHSLALRMDGTVVAWGRNDIGQSAVPTDLSDVIMIAANYYHSLALRMDGTVVAWGGNNNGQRDLPTNLSGIAAIAAGGYHTLLIEAVDSTPPTTQLTSTDAAADNPSAEFWFTGADDITPAPGLTFQCQLDGGAFSACASPQSYPTLAAGSHTFAVKAVDAAGNSAVSPETYTWTINPPAPILDTGDFGVANVSGQQLVAAAQATATALDFGTATINRASTVRYVTLDNSGNADLVVSSATFAGAQAGDFSVSAALPTIAPHSSATIAVTFAPTAAGLRQATLTVNSNAAPYVVDLQGTGSANPYPVLSVPAAPIKVTNSRFTVPVRLTTYGASLSSVGFVLNYADTCLTFDPTDSDGDGVPDAITGLPAAFAPTVTYYTTATGGALEIALLDDSQPIATLSDGPLLTLAFGVKPACVTTNGTLSVGNVSFADTPAASFGDPNAVDVAGAAAGAAIPLAFNAAPTALALSNNRVTENSPVGATIGTVSVTDPDAGDTHTYSLVAGEGDTDNAAFTLVGTTLKTAVVINYEPKPEYRIRVRVTDNGGLFFEQPLVIKTSDLSEAPTGIATTDGPSSDGNPATLDIQENQPANTLVAKLDPSNPDSNNSYTYALVAGPGDTDNASFSIVGNQLQSAVSFDYETKHSYSLRLRITDKLGHSVEQVFTVIINDVAEPFSATDDLVDPRATVFLGGQAGFIDVLANDVANGAALSVFDVTQPASGQGSVTNNTTNVLYTAPQANGSTSFTYRATNGATTSNSATVSLSYVANDARGDCNGNGGVAAADFIATVLEIFDTHNTAGPDGYPAWWLSYTGDYPGSPRGCDSNGNGNPKGANGHPQASVTAADIICSVLIFFGHPCGAGVQAANAQATQLNVDATPAASGAGTTVTVTLHSGGNNVAAAAFALDWGNAPFDATDADGDGLPDAVTLTLPAGVSKSVNWNATEQRLEVALYGTTLPLPLLAEGVLVTMHTAGNVTPTLMLASLSDADGNDLLTPRTGVFLPLVTR